MVHDLKTLTLNLRVQIIAILACQRQGEDLALQVLLQCWGNRQFHGSTRIQCFKFYDFRIQPPDFNIIEGGPDIQVMSDHPLLWINQPHCALKLADAEDLARWAAESERILTALWSCHWNLVDDFLPFGAARLRPDPGAPPPKDRAKGLSLYGPKPLMNAYAAVFTKFGFHPRVEQLDPHGQAIPGGDGAIYDPPLDLHLLLMDRSRSWVIAERFYVQEIPAAPRSPSGPSQN